MFSSFSLRLALAMSLTLTAAGSVHAEAFRVFVDGHDTFAALALEPTDSEAEEALSLLEELVVTRAHETYTTLAFRAAPDGFEPGAILGPKGFVLESVALFEGESEELGFGTREGCGCIFPPRIAWLVERLDPQHYRGMQCGNIATIHSALKLDLLTEDEAFDGEHLDQDQVRNLNPYHYSDSGNVGMTPAEIGDAHESFGDDANRVDCSAPITAEIGTPQVGFAMQSAASMVNFQAKTFDCSLIVEWGPDADGRKRPGHVEHIRGMTKTANGTWDIQTVNGFDQGATDATIPKDPGTNTWEFGDNEARMREGKPADKAQVDGAPIEKIQVVCCAVNC